LKNRFGPRNYAAEELIAELGAAFLCAEFGFDGDVRNAGYIASWIELFKADKRAFFTACSQASKAADYLRGLALADPAERAEDGTWGPHTRAAPHCLRYAWNLVVFACMGISDLTLAAAIQLAFGELVAGDEVRIEQALMSRALS
jgi:hypothetical protein